jgi:segregation and condensation protein B
MKRIIEGLLFVADSPLNLTQLAKILETEDRAAVKSALAELQEEYQGMGRAFSLAEVANGYAFRTEPDLANWLRKLRRQQASRLSPAALETLAIVAYKQPVLRAEIERLRGVDAGGTLRMLMEKDLIKVMGRKDLPGRPLIYGTTKRFLEIFGLKNLKDLPTVEEMEALIGEPEPVAVEESPQGTLDLGLSDPATRPMAS